ncbi:MAG TPA: DUF2189 domain-containing protein [Gammaproteobacteria bacterium]|nr:DUF2189 domain-containing protein [Gammaproteobacteria bacterium]
MSPIPRSTGRFSIGDIVLALRSGWATFRAIPGLSLVLGTIIASLGMGVLWGIYRIGVSAMALPFAGGFMLLGPILLAGFFRLAEAVASGRQPSIGDALCGFRQAPAGLWAVALLCAFLFMIWITDAAILYSFMIGGLDATGQLPWLNQLQADKVSFTLWSSLTGAVLAFVVFAVSAFSVPLLHQRRATLIQAVHASVSLVLRNFFVSIAWGLLLTGTILLSILLLPLLALVLPVMAYASFALYLRVFPE